jgi:hypothetical protein
VGYLGGIGAQGSHNIFLGANVEGTTAEHDAAGAAL